MMHGFILILLFVMAITFSFVAGLMAGSGVVWSHFASRGHAWPWTGRPINFGWWCVCWMLFAVAAECVFVVLLK